MLTFNMVEMEIIRWGEARGIIQNSSAIAQAVKTLEEVSELFDALNKKDLDLAKDALGDIVVTLIMVSAILDVKLLDCIVQAYNEIKNRKGYLTKEGIFVKQ